MIEPTPEQKSFHKFIASGDPSVPFEPIVFHDADGDGLEVNLTQDSFYGDPVTPRVTLYRSQKTGEIVGLRIDQLSSIMGNQS